VLPGGWIAVIALAVLVTAPLGVLIRGFTHERYRSAFTRLFVMRPFWYAQMALPLVATAGLLGAIAGAFFGMAGTIGRVAMAVTAVILFAIGLWGYIGAQRLVVQRIDVELARLPRGLEGLRIVQVSDLHVGPHTSRRHLARIRRAITDAKPELIAITGDQVDDDARDVEPFVAAFGKLEAPLGVFAIPGNHDVYAGWDAVRKGLEGAGITVLVNDSVSVVRGDTRFRVAGTGDPAAGAWRRGAGAGNGPDIDRTLAAVEPNDFTVVLAHNPALWPALADRGVDLTLSGHTHHGQLSIPSLGWSLASPFLELAMGMHQRGTSTLYINPGTNYWGVPFRIGAWPEVTVLTLKRADA
jgi:predicted MPP superfamily phosphohydrolase